MVESMCDEKDDLSWLSYDPGERRTKHKGNNHEPEFVRQGNGLIGKCPRTIDAGLAEGLLKNGIAHYPGEDEVARTDPRGRPCPRRVFNVHEGAIYVAHPTRAEAGTFHGYPFDQQGDPKRGIPRAILRQLRERAEAQGHLRAFQEWVDQHTTERRRF
ncbi:hypothetical protein [Roseospirillum parvum]|uniref:Uncharacterized protein n=1 Tax=Roseospirillum parvum TaxID=83401 RepID=A0A1G7W3J7_9PROT|nr:hypothetical protein [Roseospirillum parvum]SDG66503.1 hypothetical protein SAMN05421742_10265 [Roseospirillum parvum]